MTSRHAGRARRPGAAPTSSPPSPRAPPARCSSVPCVGAPARVPALGYYPAEHGVLRRQRRCRATCLRPLGYDPAEHGVLQLPRIHARNLTDPPDSRALHPQRIVAESHATAHRAAEPSTPRQPTRFPIASAPRSPRACPSARDAPAGRSPSTARRPVHDPDPIRHARRIEASGRTHPRVHAPSPTCRSGTDATCPQRAHRPHPHRNASPPTEARSRARTAPPSVAADGPQAAASPDPSRGPSRARASHRPSLRAPRVRIARRSTARIDGTGPRGDGSPCFASRRPIDARPCLPESRPSDPRTSRHRHRKTASPPAARRAGVRQGPTRRPMDA